MTLGENIKKYRTMLDKTQEELANELSISSQAVSKWERGESLPDSAMIPEIADALDVSIDRLYGRKKVTKDDIKYFVNGYACEDNGENLMKKMRRMLFAAGCGTHVDFDSAVAMVSIESDDGFTVGSNKKELPYYCVFEDPENGYKNVISPDGGFSEFFALLLDKDVLKTALKLFEKPYYFSFDVTFAADEFGLDDPAAVLEKLKIIGLVTDENMIINGKEIKIYHAKQRKEIIAILILVKSYLENSEYYDFSQYNRTKPYFE